MLGIQVLHHSFKTLIDSAEEFLCADLLLVLRLREQIEVACHDTVLDSLNGRLFELVGEGFEVVRTVRLAALAESTCPCEQSSNRVCGGRFAFKCL